MEDLPYRDEFIAAIEILAKANRELGPDNGKMPIIVGGAAVEFYTSGAFDTGDIDLVAAWQSEVEAALIKLGFERPRDKTRGLQHYGINVGVEVVGAAILDGEGSRDKAFIARLGPDLRVAFICAEDLIADRLGQYAYHPPTMHSRLDQAIAVWENLSDTVDRDYLDKQIRRQAPGMSLDWLEQEALKVRRHTP